MCDDPTILKIFLILSKILLIAQIFIPLIIVVRTVFEIGGKAIGTEPDSFFKILKKIGTRLLAALLIFFAPSIISFVFNVVSPDYGTNNLNCLLTVTEDKIKIAEINSADAAVTTVENDLTVNNLKVAKSKVDAVEDEDAKKALEARLKTVSNSLAQIQAANQTTISSTITNNLPANNKINTSGVSSTKNIKYYRQCDDNWRSIKYSHGTYNTCGCGCGYTSLAMVIDGITGANNTPIGIVKTILPSHYLQSSCAMTDDALYDSKIKNTYGLKATVLFDRNRTANATEIGYRKNKIVEALEQGKAVVLLIPGHYIALGSINNGKISAFNPANIGDNGEYTIDELYNKFADYKKRCSMPSNSPKACGFVYAVAYERL